MIRSVLQLLLLLPMILLGGAVSQEGKGQGAAPPKAAVKQARKELTFEAVMEDQSAVRVAFLQKAVEIATPYGILKVPAGDIEAIDFRSRPVDDIDRRLQVAVDRLGNDAFAERETGSRELAEMGPASFWVVSRACSSEDPEVQKRAKAVLEILEKKFSAEELRRPSYDTIKTPTFTIAGQVQGATLNLRTKYFGESQVKLSSIRALKSMGEGIDITLALDAAKYALPDASGWLETKVQVRGRTILIEGSGKIDMYPQPNGPSTYIATPAGPSWVGGAVPQVGPNATPQPGMILGKVGKEGKEFLIGAKYEGTPSDVGLLYLRIVPSPWRNPSTGEYKVQIRSR